MVEKYALVVGCNYQSSNQPLKGCINDARSMNDILTKNFGFKKTNVELLTDKPDSMIKPTAANIKRYLEKFLSVARSGDVVFLSFAGHTSIDTACNSQSGKDGHSILASDLDLITYSDFRKILNGAPTGVHLILISDKGLHQISECLPHGYPLEKRFDDGKWHGVSFMELVYVLKIFSNNT